MRSANELLAPPESIIERVRPYLEPVELKIGKVLYEPGVDTSHLYFPLDAIVSLLHVTQHGSSASLAVVGREGVVGIAAFMGGQSTLSRAVVSGGGRALRLAAPRLKVEFDRHGELHVLLLRYTQSLITQMAQTAVCNRHHSIDQQLSRWLLISLDRVVANRLVMTHESIADALGVRREGISAAASKLQKLGAIEYRRGKITVFDRAALERVSCECYELVRAEMRRLLG